MRIQKKIEMLILGHALFHSQPLKQLLSFVEKVVVRLSSEITLVFFYLYIIGSVVGYNLLKSLVYFDRTKKGLVVEWNLLNLLGFWHKISHIFYALQLKYSISGCGVIQLAYNQTSQPQILNMVAQFIIYTTTHNSIIQLSCFHNQGRLYLQKAGCIN